MIILEVIGGLGNQMFQYAAGVALSQRNSYTFSFDVSKFDYHKIHQGFELQSVFNCQIKTASQDGVAKLLGWQSSPFVQRILSKNFFSLVRKKEFVVEPYFNYWSGINNSPEDCYLSGYWQSEKYFLAVESKIRSDFTFKRPMSRVNKELANKVSNVNAISLHVRRGDYINDPKTNANHGLCSIEYYKSAIRHILEQTDSPYFFIFSDDLDWVKKNLEIDQPCEYIDHNRDNESYNDMRLMSLCKHHIIANSSFSWWGAWLNPSESKIVITPKQWFANGNNTQDLIPSGWLKL